MRRFSPTALCVLIILTALSCIKDKKNSLPGLWIGAHMQIDRNQYQPLPQFVQVRNDTAYLTSLTEMNRDTFIIEQQGKGLLVDTTYYDSTTFQLDGPWLRYRKPYIISLFRARSASLDVNRIEFRNLIQEKTWKSPWGILHLLEGGQAHLYKEDEDSLEKYCWSIRDVDGILMFLLHGNHMDCSQWSFPVCQILDVDQDRFRVTFAENDVLRKFSFELMELPNGSDQSDFQLCNRHLYLNLGSHHYYYKGTELFGGHYAIRKNLDAKYISRPNGFSGVIRIRFIVNCEGKTGQFETIALDESYNVVDDLPKEALSLMEITRELGPWKPGTSDDMGLEKIDTYIFIAYKLKNGEVVDILP